MRRAIFAFTVLLLAPAVMALPVGGDPEIGAAGSAVEKRQILPGGVAGSDEGGSLWGKVILAKGDKTGTGPGAGGQKGQKKGNGNSGGKGKQKGKKG
jgi:hypothetical protein